MYIKVKVVTSAKKEKIQKRAEDSFVFWVKEKPERNLANARVIQLLADHFNVSIKKIKIINGHHHSSKILSIS